MSQEQSGAKWRSHQCRGLGAPRNDLPQSLAIAGAWGYIGRKFLDVALRRRIPTVVYDPGDLPADVEPSGLTRLSDDAEFYRLPADLFHLATHPDHRRTGQQRLLERARQEPLAILNEKPMAAPDSPEECSQIVAAVRRSRALMLYDFPELYDPLTERILDHLRSYRDLRITDISMCRSKDREAPDNSRNYKRMVPIQYQESVHCLAYVLFVLARLRGSLAEVFDGGVSLRAESEPYTPPNPEIYSYVVDGRCGYQFSLGTVQVKGRTDFQAGAEFTKRRVLRGNGNGRPFCIEANYLEGRKRLSINGVEQAVDPHANSYESVLQAFTRWRRESSREELMEGIYPNPAFARITYQLSSALWRASRDRFGLRLANLDALLGFDAGFRESLAAMPRYG
jgi:predicted dehydrogenase